MSVNEESEDSAEGPGRAAVVSTLLLLFIYLITSTGAQAFHDSPNAAGIRRVMQLLGGPLATFDEFVAGTKALPKGAPATTLSKLKGGWIVGGYLSPWLPAQLPDVFKGASFRVVQDILPNALTDAAQVVLPAAAWAEKDGCWENHAGRIQAFSAAIPPPDGARREGNVYYQVLGRPRVRE